MRTERALAKRELAPPRCGARRKRRDYKTRHLTWANPPRGHSVAATVRARYPGGAPIPPTPRRVPHLAGGIPGCCLGFKPRKNAVRIKIHRPASRAILRIQKLQITARCRRKRRRPEVYRAPLFRRTYALTKLSREGDSARGRNVNRKAHRGRGAASKRQGARAIPAQGGEHASIRARD